jgi:hypothetical protein
LYPKKSRRRIISATRHGGRALRWDHLVPDFVSLSDALEHVPGKDRQIPPLASPGAKTGNIRMRFLKKSRGFDNFASPFP